MVTFGLVFLLALVPFGVIRSSSRSRNLIIIPLAMLWVAYQLGWYGYATLQQPVGLGGCVGFTDLILPSRVSKVDSCIQAGWGNGSSSGGSGGSSGQNPSPVLPNPGVGPGQSGPGGQGNQPSPGGPPVAA